MMRYYSILLAALLNSMSVGAQHGEERISTVYIINADGTGERALFLYPASASGISVSPDGTRIAYSGKGPDIWIANIDGSDSFNFTNTAGVSEFYPAWSPDGGKIAYSASYGSDSGSDVLIKDLTSGAIRNLTDLPSNEGGPTWSPDGRQIAFSSNRDGTTQIYVTDVEDGPWINLTNDFTSGVHYVRPSWSPAGSVISYATRSASGSKMGLIYLADDTREEIDIDPAYRLPEGLFSGWSPDGTRLAFAARVKGDTDILVMDIASRSIVNLTNGPGSNTNPAWTPDGRVVFSAARRKQDILEDLGPDTVLIIIEGGGIGISGRDGDMPPIVLQHTTPSGKIEYVPLSKAEAERLLRQQGIASPNLDEFYKP